MAVHYTIALLISRKWKKIDDCIAALYWECGVSFEENRDQYIVALKGRIPAKEVRLIGALKFKKTGKEVTNRAYWCPKIQENRKRGNQ